MAANGTGADNRIDQVVNQLRDQIGALERHHSHSVSQAVRPVQQEVAELRRALERSQRKVDALERDFKSFQLAERERAREHEALQAGWRDATAATAAAEWEIAVIDNLLAGALPSRPPAFGELTDPGLVPDFDAGRLGVTELAPDWADYDPGPPGFWTRATGLTGGYERKLEDARAGYRADCDSHREREALRQLDLAERRRLYDQGVAEVRAHADARNAEVERMQAAFAAGDQDAIAWFVHEALLASVYPAWYPGHARRYLVACRQDRAGLLVELELPAVAAIPVVRHYEYDEHLAERRAVPRPPAEVTAQYAGLIASVALRTASDALAASAERADAVRAVTVNGRATGIEGATGEDSRPHLISVSVTRETLNGLFLDRVQPLLCLVALGGRISLDPLARKAVEPLEVFPEY